MVAKSTAGSRPRAVALWAWTSFYLAFSVAYTGFRGMNRAAFATKYDIFVFLLFIFSRLRA
jgi:hypothetical protein